VAGHIGAAMQPADLHVLLVADIECPSNKRTPWHSRLTLGRTIWAWSASNCELQKPKRSKQLASLVQTVRQWDM